MTSYMSRQNSKKDKVRKIRQNLISVISSYVTHFCEFRRVLAFRTVKILE